MVSQPERIGRYRIESVIGVGGFATVYRAHDERLDAMVAVKLLAENHSLDPDVRERFLQEGRVLRHIGSAHVVAVHDLGETERGQPYLVLDLADRGDLARRVQERRAGGWRPGPADLLSVAEPLAEALAGVHASRIVHRDLAPKNLLLRSTRVPVPGRAPTLVDADEVLVLADLGLSKDLATASGFTVTGGTAGFTPPEQRDGPGRVDHRADLWAASAVLVWLALGHPPDDGGAWPAELAASGWPPALAAMLATELAVDPAGRSSDAATWLVTFRRALAAPTAPPPAVPRPPPPARAPGRRRVALAAAVAAVVGALGGVVGVRSVDDDNGGAEQQVEELSGGRQRAEASDGGRDLAITGPREVVVGETASFEAESAGVESTVWVGPDGRLHPDAAALDVATRSPGRATVRLIGADEQGRTLEVELDVRVVEE